MSSEKVRVETAEVKPGAPSSKPGEVLSPKSRGVAFILALILPFVGLAGIQRLYVGKILSGVIWLLTWGLLGFGQIVDIIRIGLGSFTDKEGRPVRKS